MQFCQCHNIAIFLLLVPSAAATASDHHPSPLSTPSLFSLDHVTAATPSRHSSRARIETPVDEDVLLAAAAGLNDDKDNEWKLRDLDVRSPVYATSNRNVVKTNTSPSSRPKIPELKLHLQDTTPHTLPPPSQFINHKKHWKKTGTTIAGCLCRGHVILAADTRATQDTIVADPTALKLHPLAQNAWCAGAGTSADLEMVTRLCLYSLALEQLRYTTIGNNQRQIGAVTPLFTSPDKEQDGNALLVGHASLERICSFLQDHIQEARGALGVSLILGCVDRGTPYLRAFHGHGSMDVDLPFAALGSGGLAAISILERGYHANLTVPQAIELVQSAIVAGIQNDLGSGSQVDMCIIAPDGTSRLERCVVPAQKLPELETVKDEDTAAVAAPNPNSVGTNGFGNTPFGISSQRVIVESKRVKEMMEWSYLLGL